ncbi:MAG: peptidylprolyl isomerase [Thermofilum sp. ex4484_15]|nr:MAG: peptidylprolyl isomerase [Thermofilum sp. ex4484_15]
MPLSKGDYILIEYTAMIKNEGKVFDTTNEEEAKKHGIYEEGRIYEPFFIILGEGWLPRGLEKRLEGLEVGEEKEIELPPEEAFGRRDPKKIKVLPALELSKRGIIPRVNREVEINGLKGVIRSVGGGRVVIDFNHPLADKTLVYKIKIIKRVENLEEKVRELVHRWLRTVEREDIVAKVEGGIITVKLPMEVFSLERLPLLLRGVVSDIKKYISEAKLIRFVEEFKLKGGDRAVRSN